MWTECPDEQPTSGMRWSPGQQAAGNRKRKQSGRLTSKEVTYYSYQVQEKERRANKLTEHGIKTELVLLTSLIQKKVMFSPSVMFFCYV